MCKLTYTNTVCEYLKSQTEIIGKGSMVDSCKGSGGIRKIGPHMFVSGQELVITLKSCCAWIKKNRLQILMIEITSLLRNNCMCYCK